MAIRVALHHLTTYQYDRPVILEPHVVRLRPAPHCRTPIVSYSLTIHPADHFCNWQQDPYGNYLARLVFQKPANCFQVEVDLIAELTAINPFDFFAEPYAETFPFRYDPVLARELTPYLETAPAGPRLTQLVAEMGRDQIRTVDFLVEMNSRLQQKVRYVIRLEPGIQTCEETLALGSGSCRDTAWLLVQLMRRLGLAARFVSGYLIQLTADVKPLEGPAGPARDFTDLHAWAEVYLPGAGWIGLDQTSGLFCGEGHIPLACSADPINAAPISGVYSFTKKCVDDRVVETFQHSMEVTRIHEDPRVTRPYSEAQWSAINSLGLQIDQRLGGDDVRLTMGGEPTFVAIDNRDALEWNTAALGVDKRTKAGVLLRRLRDRFAPGALLHFGQGKWYPGESLPRWSLGCYWRKDGQPIWNDPTLIAEDNRDYGYGAEDAKAFVSDLARRLEVAATNAQPAHEDLWYYLWRERNLPVNVDPMHARLESSEERARLARVFDQGLGQIVGYALPLKRERQSGQSFWVGGRWFFRREHLYLTPGDSPMGYRLPLDSLPWEPPGQREVIQEQDPWTRPGPLPAKGDLSQRYFHIRQPARSEAIEVGLREPVVRTALCVEARGGRLFVFMPPQDSAEDYLDLVAAVEATARALIMPVQIEGYPPPQDARLQTCKITPDPGVIEVNVQPAGDWNELVANTTALYEEAGQARLAAEKFMLDGRHVGTGGGNHLVLGGSSPADSPLLRRPDLLRSLLGYWHNHPSLSYLFSGLFVGPTSQAPRVDEARNDSLYELEIAFRQLEREKHCPPWLVDRLFRHLLIDATGNTHRAEFCIDKLFSPDSTSGRLGLLEFRAFEMPPHPRMNLVQQLLVRALVSWFWRQPYNRRLVRWGTELHDRFMLPHFIGQDFRDVLEELARADMTLDETWFAPHFEFRFPLVGTLVRQGVTLELRQAVEPWHVLGEEGAPGGTARFVDSSVERLQVKVRGWINPRLMLTCNGRRVPLQPTGVNGEYVAGVRFRAWQPPSCLHPTLGIDAPLIFDLYDTWLQRSLGGCTYQVAHPGGLSHDRLPVNANEAEGRRGTRFFQHGHSPATFAVYPETQNPECPWTLDLRQSGLAPATTITPPPGDQQANWASLPRMKAAHEDRGSGIDEPAAAPSRRGSFHFRVPTS